MTSRHRRFVLSALALATVLGACGRPGTNAQGGDGDRQGAGTTPEQGQGTAVNDTAPHRPGAPAGPQTGNPATEKQDDPTQKP